MDGEYNKTPQFKTVFHSPRITAILSSRKLLFLNVFIYSYQFEGYYVTIITMFTFLFWNGFLHVIYIY